MEIQICACDKDNYTLESVYLLDGISTRFGFLGGKESSELVSLSGFEDLLILTAIF